MVNKRLSSPEEFEKLRKDILSKRDPNRSVVSICTMSACGQARGSLDIYQRFQEEIKHAGLEAKVEIKSTGCQGFCEREPVVIIFPEGIYYLNVSLEDVPEIVSKTLVKKEILERLVYEDPVSGKKIAKGAEIPFYQNQSLYVIGNNRHINPKDIEDYITLGGYTSLHKTLFQMTPEQVVE